MRETKIQLREPMTLTTKPAIVRTNVPLRNDSPLLDYFSPPAAGCSVPAGPAICVSPCVFASAVSTFSSISCLLIENTAYVQ